MVTVTDQAAAKVKELLSERNMAAVRIRLSAG